MPVYVAMIRGINVGGHKIVRMAELRKSCETAGLEKVQTYVQSGNVIFKASRGTAESVSRKIEGVILADFGHAVTVITRIAAAINSVLASNPFLQQKGTDLARLYVTFLSAEPAKPAVKKLLELRTPPEDFRPIGREIYLHLPSLGNSQWGRIPLERLLGVRATTRNWNTIQKLCEMASACG